jgi:hypothetical protein
MHVVFYSSLGVNCKMFFHAAVYFFLDFFQNVFAIPVCWTLSTNCLTKKLLGLHLWYWGYGYTYGFCYKDVLHFISD